MPRFSYAAQPCRPIAVISRHDDSDRFTGLLLLYSESVTVAGTNKRQILLAWYSDLALVSGRFNQAARLQTGFINFKQGNTP
jgi:hypothetical protein